MKAGPLVAAQDNLPIWVVSYLKNKTEESKFKVVAGSAFGSGDWVGCPLTRMSMVDPGCLQSACESVLGQDTNP